jgi:hypothetical protein
MIDDTLSSEVHECFFSARCSARKRNGGNGDTDGKLFVQIVGPRDGVILSPVAGADALAAAFNQLGGIAKDRDLRFCVVHDSYFLSCL